MGISLCTVDAFAAGNGKVGSQLYNHTHLQFNCLFNLIIVIINLNTMLWIIYLNKMSFNLVTNLGCLNSLQFFKLYCMTKIRFLLV